MASQSLLLSAIFILWCLWREHRRFPFHGLALWIPTSLLFILSSRPVSSWIGMSSSVEGAWPDQLYYFVIITVSLMIGYSRRVNWQRLFGANTALSLFYLYFAVSSVWSEDPGGSFKRWFKLLGIIFVVAIILSDEKPMEAMKGVYVRCACIVFPLSIVFIKYFPALGRNYSKGGGDPMLTGVSTQKNTLGEMTLVISLFLLWECLEATFSAEKGRSLLRRIPWNRVILLLMGVYLLYISQSKTSLMCLLIGLALMLARRWLTSRVVSGMTFLIALSLPFFLFLTQQFTSVFTPLLSILGRDATLTGRTGIWQHIGLTTVNPLVGDGYFSFWGTAGGEALRAAMNDTGVHSAHNGYLDIYLDGGFIGLGFLFCLLLAWGRKSIAILRSSLQSKDKVPWFQGLRFAFLIAFIIYNLSEATFARLAPTWFTAMLLFVQFESNKLDL